MLTAGTHKVTHIAGCFLGESPEKKTPYIQLEFVTETGESIDWIAWLSTATESGVAAANKHIETIKKLGYKSDKISDMADPSKSVEDLFGDAEDEINIVVEMEVFDTQNGSKERPIVKWVNVGFQSGLTKFDHKQAVVKFKSLPFDGVLKKLKSGEKLPPKAKATETKAAPKSAPAEGSEIDPENPPF